MVEANEISLSDQLTSDKLAKLELKEFLQQWANHFPLIEESKDSQSEEPNKVLTLLRFARAARIKKVIEFGNNAMTLNQATKDLLTQQCEPFILHFRDLEKIILSPDVSLGLAAMALLETSAATEKLQTFEYSLALTFIKNCIQTTFPDYRQKFMKPITFFFLRLRSVFAKDIKKFDPSCENEQHKEKTKLTLEPLVKFIAEIIDYSSRNLYMDKAIEGSFPLFDVLKLIQDYFGGHEFKINKAKIFEPVNLLEKFGLFQNKSLFYFLVNSLKSSWANVRHTSFSLLSKYADNYPEFHNANFVNNQLIPTALEFCNDPRSMMAEACGLMLKLALTKCIKVVDIFRITFQPSSEAVQNDQQLSDSLKRKMMLEQVFGIVKLRLVTF